MVHICQIGRVGFRLLGPYLRPLALSIRHFCEIHGVVIHLLGLYLGNLELSMDHLGKVQAG